MDEPTGEIREVRYGRECWRVNCVACGPRRAALVARALHIVQPEVFITLGRLGETTEQVLTAVKRLRRFLREHLGVAFEDAFFIERHRRTGDLHVHMYAFPVVTEQQLLAAGVCSDVKVERITHHGRLDYGLKNALDPATLPEYLELNGMRLVHASKGFWRDGTGVRVYGGYPELVRRQRLLARRQRANRTTTSYAKGA